MTYFIISFVIIILLVVVMSLILKNAVKQVDEKSKSYFVDKLKEYDYLIDEKEKKLSELESELLKRINCADCITLKICQVLIIISRTKTYTVAFIVKSKPRNMDEINS